MRDFGLKLFLKCSAIALMTTAGAGALVIGSAEPAYANNGNGNGNGRDRAERTERGNGNKAEREARGNSGNRGNNGRGAIASELKSLNAAHASQTALESASEDSMPGKLYVYQQSVLAASTAAETLQEAEDLYTALTEMTEERFYELNPTLDYETTLAEAETAYSNALSLSETAEGDIDTSLAALTGGRELSDAALAELHALLGL